MRDELNEQLSALVDDELRKDEADLLLRQLARSKELRTRFARYSLISAALHRNLSVATGSDLAERVAAALEDEPSYGGNERRYSRIGMLLRPAAGLALAVTGAMAVVTMWPHAPPPGAPEQAVGPIAAVPGVTAQSLQPIEANATPGVEISPNVVAYATTSPQRQWEHLDPQVRLQLTGYLIKHSSLLQQDERSATGNMDASLPYMRMIVHEANE
ncbi:MAG: hypothetical protein L0H63_13610 [Nitrococcus sp.]|nr:hypothetical protein [Nitrococcus sp.]